MEMEIDHIDRIVWGVIALTLSLLYLYLSHPYLAMEDRVYSEGVVIDTEMHTKRTIGRTSTLILLVEYEADGYTYVGELLGGAHPNIMGSKVEIVYNGDNPEEVYTQTSTFTYVLTGLFIIVGSIQLTKGLIDLFRSKWYDGAV